MTHHLAKFVGFTIISSTFGLAYIKYSQFAAINDQSERMMTSGQLENFLFRFHEEHAYQSDAMMNEFEKGYNLSTIHNYKKALLQFAEGKVLQTCAGTNRNLKFYNPGVNLTLVDFSPNIAAIGSAKSLPTLSSNYIVGNVMKLPFKDNEFDTVVDIFGLEYVFKPQKALQQMMRVCKENGRIILMNEGLSSILEFHWYENAKWGVNLYEKGYFSNRNWEKMVKETGLEIESFERKKNGKIYIYILKNNKGSASQKASEVV